MTRDFTYNAYKQLLETVLENGYCFQTYEAFADAPAEKVVIMRHDVDRKPENGLKMAQLETELGIGASYYFRIVSESWDEPIIKSIKELGHEIGYHYEDLSLCKGDPQLALKDFETHLERLRGFYPVKTMCMHGSPASRWDNRDVWKHADYKQYGIIAEPYFDLDFNRLLYITDASRRWDGEKVTVRDKVDSVFDFTFSSTSDICAAFAQGKLPDKVMINIHPHNWSGSTREWIKTKYFQAIKIVLNESSLREVGKMNDTQDNTDTKTNTDSPAKANRTVKAAGKTPIDRKFRRIRISNFWPKTILDGLLLLLTYFGMYLIKRGNLNMEPVYLKVLPVIFFCWILSSLLGQKFRNNLGKPHMQRLKPYIVSQLVFTAFLSVALFAIQVTSLSRFIIFGSIAVHFLVELLFLSDIYLEIFKREETEKPDDCVDCEEPKEEHFSFVFFMLELLFITASFVWVYRLKTNSYGLQMEYFRVLAILYFLWIFTGIVIHKFKLKLFKSYLKTIFPFLKSTFIIVSIVSIVFFGYGQMRHISRLVIFGSMALFHIFELAFISIVYIYRKPQETDEPTGKIFSVPLLEEQEKIDMVTNYGEAIEVKVKPPESVLKSTFIYQKLKNIYLKREPDVFEFVEENVDLSKIDIVKAESINTMTLYNIEILPDEGLEFFLNLHQMNDFRRLNRYLIEVNKKLNVGSIFVSRFQPKERRSLLFNRRYPKYLARILYLIDFVWKRAFPKLPFFQKIYFAVSRGRNRVLTMAEALGRLYYCGFEVKAMKDIDDSIYFVARKIKEPSDNPKPSYSPVFKMARVGKNGKIIYVYKFRTMHPYSEYLQDFVLTKFGYADSGKPANDFRVTAWGKFLRKFWLDELPQLINVFKGEMRILGIRPVSQRFLQEFPDDIRELRAKHKPGCIPAYVSLLKRSKDGFIEAETQYILEKEKSPYMTDIKYFFLAIYNIAANKIRSE